MYCIYVFHAFHLYFQMCCIFMYTYFAVFALITNYTMPFSYRGRSVTTVSATRPNAGVAMTAATKKRVLKISPICPTPTRVICKVVVYCSLKSLENLAYISDSDSSDLSCLRSLLVEWMRWWKTLRLYLHTYMYLITYLIAGVYIYIYIYIYIWWLAMVGNIYIF